VVEERVLRFKWDFRAINYENIKPFTSFPFMETDNIPQSGTFLTNKECVLFLRRLRVRKEYFQIVCGVLHLS
jgi:hypothetical protein